LHGTPRERIEERLKGLDSNFDFHKVVDVAGRLARDLILGKFEKPSEPALVQFLQPSTFVDWRTTGKAHVQIAVPGNPDDPQIEHAALPQVSFNRVQRLPEAGPPLHSGGPAPR
jgi:hypothetical protein